MFIQSVCDQRAFLAKLVHILEGQLTLPQLFTQGWVHNFLRYFHFATNPDGELQYSRYLAFPGG